MEKELCVTITCFKIEKNRKVTFIVCGNGKKIDFVLIKYEQRQFIQKARVISGKPLHAFVVADVDKRKIRNVVRKTCTESRKISLLKDARSGSDLK